MTLATWDSPNRINNKNICLKLDACVEDSLFQNTKQFTKTWLYKKHIIKEKIIEPLIFIPFILGGGGYYQRDSEKLIIQHVKNQIDTQHMSEIKEHVKYIYPTIDVIGGDTCLIKIN